MWSGTDPQVLRLMWPGLVPLGMWICGFLLVVIWAKAEKRRLLKIVFWAFPVFLIPTAYFVYAMVVVSKHPF